MNLFDLADNDLYRRYSRRSAEAVGKHGGKVVALGKLAGAEEGDPGTEPRTAMILVEWPSREAFDAFLQDPENADLHRYVRAGPKTTCGGPTSGWRTCAPFSRPLGTVSELPDEWLRDDPSFEDAEEVRAAYPEYLTNRLEEPRPWVWALEETRG